MLPARDGDWSRAQTEYERARDMAIERNREYLRSLGLESPQPPPPRAAARRAPRRERAAAPPPAARASKRLRAEQPAHDGAMIDAAGDDGRSRAEPLPASAGVAGVLSGVRAFVDEHAPDGWAVHERTTLGMRVWTLRDHLLLGVSLRAPARLLACVGEAAAAAQLRAGAHRGGVSRCEAWGGQRLPGALLLVELAHFRGNERLRHWFDLALAHSRTLQPLSQPERLPERRAQQTAAACAGSGQPDRLAQRRAPAEASAARAAAPPRAAARLAWRVLRVIERIPVGKVAAYGQVAALAGYPGRARLVGRLLAEGLCRAERAPWQRVLGASGRISLAEGAGGRTQRELLGAEGVRFGPSGGVVAGTFWERTEPLFDADWDGAP